MGAPSVVHSVIPLVRHLQYAPPTTSFKQNWPPGRARLLPSLSQRSRRNARAPRVCRTATRPARGTDDGKGPAKGD